MKSKKQIEAALALLAVEYGAQPPDTQEMRQVMAAIPPTQSDHRWPYWTMIAAHALAWVLDQSGEKFSQVVDSLAAASGQSLDAVSKEEKPPSWGVVVAQRRPSYCKVDRKVKLRS